MPRWPVTGKTTKRVRAPPTSAQCTECGRLIQRKSDMARHMRTHAPDKSQLMHACPICGYENMQKSNVDTHIRTHTKLKSRSCPDNDCSFSTSDPGSLTRHRKRAHGYVPKPRRPRDRTVPYAPRSLSSSASPQGPPSTSPVVRDDESAGSDSDGDGMGQHPTQDDLQRTVMVAHVPRKIRGAL